MVAISQAESHCRADALCIGAVEDLSAVGCHSLRNAPLGIQEVGKVDEVHRKLKLVSGLLDLEGKVLSDTEVYVVRPGSEG